MMGLCIKECRKRHSASMLLEPKKESSPGQSNVKLGFESDLLRMECRRNFLMTAVYARG